MGEEVIDGDVGDVLFVGRLAVLVSEDAGWAEDFVGEVELAFFDEAEDGDRGDGLGDAGDAKEVCGVYLKSVLFVSHSACLVVDELAVAGDGNGECGHGKLPAEGAGDAAHLPALSSVGLFSC